MSLQLPLRVAARDAFTVPAHERESPAWSPRMPERRGFAAGPKRAVVLRLPDDWVVG